jgi:hypothetical protein
MSAIQGVRGGCWRYVDRAWLSLARLLDLEIRNRCEPDGQDDFGLQQIARPKYNRTWG